MFCSKCGKEIPEESKFCSHCGYKAEPEKTDKNDHPLGYEPMSEVKSVNGKESKAKKSGCGTIFLAIIGLVFVVYVIQEIEKGCSGGSTKDTAPKTQVELRKEEIGKHFSAWDGSHIGLTKLIKKSMNDPSSYKHDETIYWDKGDHLVVKTTFRGKNAFGGVVKNWIIAKVDLDGNVIEVISQG